MKNREQSPCVVNEESPQETNQNRQNPKSGGTNDVTLHRYSRGGAGIGVSKWFTVDVAGCNSRRRARKNVPGSVGEIMRMALKNRLNRL